MTPPLPGFFVAPRPCRAVLFDQDIMHRVSPPSGGQPAATTAADADANYAVACRVGAAHWMMG
jgi:hypothetical protein